MDFDIAQASQMLSRTPSTLQAMLLGIDDTCARSNYGPDTFSPFDVVGHLIHGERTDWIPRARHILEFGESKPFEPFDRYAMFEECAGQSLGELLAVFETLRRENLTALDELGLTAEQLTLRGSHPTLGPVTLKALLAAWVVHDLNHVAQVGKAISFQYRKAVGPWLPFMSILKPPDPAD